MRNNKTIRFICLQAPVLFVILCFSFCKKESDDTGKAKLKSPVRSYVVTARIDKKGTNSKSEGIAVLKGEYNEQTKLFSYILEYKYLVPDLISFRNGPKGSVGTLIKEVYVRSEKSPALPLSGSITLSPLQERNLLKGQWFVAIGTIALSPEISGYLTLKQK